MATSTPVQMLEEALELAQLLRPAWAHISDRIPDWHPRAEADDDPADSDDPADAGDRDGGDGAPHEEPAGRANDGAGDRVTGDGSAIDWKAMARRHERRAKQAAKERDELAARLRKIEDANKSEQEKAIQRAREEAAAEIRSRYEAERRAQRLELAVTRQATRGVKLTLNEGGKTVEKTVRFADPDDALAHLERAIKRGDIDGDAIFDDDGRVDTQALNAALAELLEQRPHLQARTEREAPLRPPGSSDAGRGSGGGKSLEDLSVDEHFQRIRKKR